MNLAEDATVVGVARNPEVGVDESDDENGGGPSVSVDADPEETPEAQSGSGTDETGDSQT